MKRALFVGMFMLLLATLVACTPAPSEPDAEGERAVSIVRMCEQAKLSIDQAKDLLDVLETLGYSGEVLFAYPATDADDVEHIHVWIGERTVDAYYGADGQIASIRQSGIVIYGSDTSGEGETNEPSEPSKPSEPSEPVEPSKPVEPSTPEEPSEPEQPPMESTLHLDGMSAQVSAGSKAFVRVYGRAGEQYRIKVYLKSGASSAKGLEDKTADADGLIAWEWNVSSRTTPGEYCIVIARISDERDALELPFTILPKE